MPTHLHSAYRDHLTSAYEAVKRRDKPAAMYCLGQALRIANRVSPQHRKAVMRAMSFARRIGS